MLVCVGFTYERKHAKGRRRTLCVHLAVRLNALKGDPQHFTIFIEINVQTLCAAPISQKPHMTNALSEFVW